MHTCPVCSESVAKLDRHHLTPKAMGGSNKSDNIFLLCRLCHEDVHEFFGRGHEYSGPTDATTLVAALQGEHWDSWRELRGMQHFSRQESVDAFIKAQRSRPTAVRKALWLLSLKRHQIEFNT